MKQHIHTAQPQTLAAFFNSLLAETTIARVDTTAANPSGGVVVIPLTSDSHLRLPLLYASPTQRHRYTGEIQRLTADGATAITFAEAVSAILTHHFADIDAAKGDRFMQRVSESGAYTQRAEEYRRQHGPAVNGFIDSEQALTGGHNMHPAAKSCEPLTLAQQRAFLPEFGGEFALQWLAVHRDHLAGNSALGQPVRRFLLELWQRDFAGDLAHLPSSDYVPLPMHPLQAEAWLASASAQALGDKVQLLPQVSGGWTATSSTRAIYHPNHQWMLKVSLPVKLTNSLRLLTAAEAERGIQFSHLLRTAAGAELQQRLPTTLFLEEPVWCGISDLEQRPMPLSVVCFRHNPLQQAQAASDQFHLLASANQVSDPRRDTVTGSWVKLFAKTQNLSIAVAAKKWLSAFLDAVIHPICVVRCDYGIVLLAHQQNILVQIAAGCPTGVALRDCQGMGLTDLALTRFESVFAREQAGYFMSTAQVNPYQAYYVLGNTLLSTLAAIAADCQVQEAELWQVCRDKFDQYRRRHPQDSSFYDYLLQSKTLRWKRNFFCFLADFNEATLADPAEIYCETANPLRDDSDQTPHPTAIYKQLPDGRELQFSNRQQTATSLTFAVRILASDQPTRVFEGQLLPSHSSPTAAQLHCTQVRLRRVPADSSQTAVTGGAQAAVDALDARVWFSAMEHVQFFLRATHISASQLKPAEIAQISAYLPTDALAITGTDGITIAHRTLLEYAPLWLRTPPQSQPLVTVTAESGRRHPQRPKKPTGVLYQRYFYHLDRTITVRVLDIERDLACFSEWHNVPSTHAIWELAGSDAEHRAYLQGMQDAPEKFAVIGEYDGVPFGYFELYWTAEDRLGGHYDYQDYDRGVHILVGNVNFRGSNYFQAWAKAVMQFIYQDEPRTQRVMGEPRADNLKVIAIAEGVGMQKQCEFDFPHKRAALLQCDRPRYFEHFAI